MAYIIDISAGENHTLALKRDGTVYAWGNNTLGAVGDGTGIPGDGSETIKQTPVKVFGLSDVVLISAGRYASSALKRDGTVWGWGYNMSGEIGPKAYINQRTPILVDDFTDIIYNIMQYLHGWNKE